MPTTTRPASRKSASPRPAAKKATAARKATRPAKPKTPAKAKFETPAKAKFETPAKAKFEAPAPTAAADKPASEKAAKTGKQRVALVRDGFTMPESDFALIAALKARALAAQREAKKSELLRAGLHALAALDGPSLVQALNRLVPIKTGRPKKNH